ARADGFRIEFERRGDFFVAEVGEIAQLDHFLARPAELLQRFANQFDVLGVQQYQVRSRQRARGVERQAVFRILGLQRNRDLPTTTFGGVLLLAIVMRFVRGDAEQPGLKARVALKRSETLDDGQKSFLANLLDVLAREVRRKLENETSRGRVV